ncbi:MAG: RHS repeat-associated core domain-containing protein [Verrucomicrobiota bacterium]
MEHKLTGVGAGLLLHQAPLPPTAYGFAAGDPVDLVVVSEMIDLNADLRLTLSGRSDAEQELESISRLQATGFEERPIDFFGAQSSMPHRIDRGYAYWTAEGLQLGADLNPESPEDAADAADREVGVRTALVRTDEGRLLLYEAIGRDLVDRAAARGLLAPPPADAAVEIPALASLESLSLPEGERWSQEARVRFASELAQLTQSRADRVEARLTDHYAPVAETMELAAGSSGLQVEPGLYIDYETVSTGTISTLRLLAGRTYYVSGAVSVSNQLTIEGGAVVKLSGGGKITLLNGAQIVTPQEHWAPATFVSKNCDDIGALISGSTGTPARGDYQRCLVLYDQAGGTIQNLRLAHSWQALEVVAGAWEIGNMVFRDHYCSLAIMQDASVVLRNSLVHTGKYWVFRLYVDNDTIGAAAPVGDQYQLQVEHVTVIGDNNYVVRYDWTGAGTGYSTFKAINSIFGWPSASSFCSRNNTSIAWQDKFQACAFRSSTDPSVGMREACLTMTQSTDNYFTAQSTGNYYLASTVNGLPNPLINSGISTESFRDFLADKSALAPAVLPSIWDTAGRLPTLSGDGTQYDALDLGYHYPKVDAIVGTAGLSVEANLELTAGQVVATDGMIAVLAAATLVSQGSAAAPVVLIPCWQISDELVGYRPSQSADKWYCLWVPSIAGSENLIQNTVINGFWRGAVLDPRRVDRFRDNQISIFDTGVYNWSADEGQSGYSGELMVENCMFKDLGGSAEALFQLESWSTMRCCTFLDFDGSTVIVGTTGKATVVNSLFAGSSLPWVVDPSRFAIDHCGFFETNIPINTTQPRACTVSPFAQGPLGAYYLNSTPSGGDLLRGNPATTAKGGTGTAAANGVYHRTVDPQAAIGESDNEVSIGYHYPPSPIPDTDADGLPDADEDTNGDGLVDIGETDPLHADSDGDFFTDAEERAFGTDPLSAGDTPAVEGQAQSQEDPCPFEKARGFRIVHPGDPNGSNATYSDFLEIEADQGVVFLLLRARIPSFFNQGTGEELFSVGGSEVADIGLTGYAYTGYDGPPYLSQYDVNGKGAILVPVLREDAGTPELMTCTILVKVDFDNGIVLCISGNSGNIDGASLEVMDAWPAMECDDQYDPTAVDFVLDAPDFVYVEGQDIQNCCDVGLQSGMCLSCSHNFGGANVRLDRGMEISFNAGRSWDSSAPAKIVLKVDSLDGAVPELTPETCYTVRNAGDHVVRNAGDLSLYQMRTAEAIVHVSDSKLYFYPITDALFWETPSYDLDQIDPATIPWLVRWTLGTDSNNNGIILTRATSTNPLGSVEGSTDITTNEYRIIYDPLTQDWSLITDYGTTQAHETTQVTTKVGLCRVVTEFKKYPSLPDVSVTERTYRSYPWGEELVKEVLDPSGVARTTTWEYHISGTGFGSLKKVTYPDGMWAAYGYLPEDGGRLSTKTTPWTDGHLHQVVEYDYGPHTTNDVVKADDFRPRTIVTRIGGGAVNATMVEYRADTKTKTEKRSPNQQNPAWNDPANEVSVWTYHSPLSQIGGKEQVKSHLRPDGHFTFIDLKGGEIEDLVSSALYPGLNATQIGVCRMTFTGTDPTVTNKDIFLYKDKSTVEVRVETMSGMELVRELYVFTGTNRKFTAGDFNPAAESSLFSRMCWVRTTYDGLGRWITKTYDDGSTETQTWVADSSCCNGKDHVDRNGVETEYRYDVHGNLISQTRQAIPQISQGGVTYPAIPALVKSFVYDEAGRQIEQVEDDGTNSLITTWVYNGAGELVSVTNPAGGTVFYGYGIDSWGRRYEEQTLPDGGSIRTTFYLDGQMASETGSATLDRYWEHGVTSETSQSFVREVRGSTDSSDTTLTYYDAMGRPIRKEAPSFGGGNPTVEEYQYDSMGRLICVSRSGYADRYFTYDDMGNRLFEGTDLDGIAGIQAYSAHDQVSKTNWGYRSLSRSLDGQTDVGWFYYTENSGFFSPGYSTSQLLLKTYDRVSLAGDFLPTSRKLKGRVESTVDGDTEKIILNNPAIIWTSERTEQIGTTQFEERGFRADLLHIQVSQTSPEIRFEYDGHGRERFQLQIASPVNCITGITETVYLSNSPHISLQREGLDSERTPSSALSQVSYTYDDVGRVIEAVNMNGTRIKTEYNARGNTLRTWGDAAQPVSYQYDEWGRIVSMKTYRGGSNWNAATWAQISTGDADETTWTYDEATGLLVQKVDSDLEGYTLEYFPNGQLKKRTWARGAWVEYDYHGAYYGDVSGTPNSGLLAAKRFSGTTPEETYQYQARTDLLREIVDQAGTRTFAYDPSRGMLLSKETIQGGGLFSKQLELIPTYLANNRIGGVDIRQDGISSPPLYAVDYYYHLGSAVTPRLQKVLMNGNPSTSFTYSYLNGTGPVERIEFGPFSRRMTYSTAAERRMLLTDVSNVLVGQEDEETFSKYSYLYNSVGERVSMESSGTIASVWPSIAWPKENIFTYNSRGELIGAANGVASEAREYAYDPIGNRTTSTQGIQPTTDYTTNSLNQYTLTANPLEEFIYDLDGNLQTTGDFKMEYDAENRLVSIYPKREAKGDKKVVYQYDYMGRRISRKVWTKTSVDKWPEESSASPTSFKKYVWDGWHLLAELNGKNNDAALVTYTWGPDLSGTFGGAGGVGGLLGISKKTVPTANLACLYDGNGNITQLVDMATGDAKAHYEYDPFGNLIQSEGESGLETWNKFRYSTKQIEEELLIPTTSSSAGVSPDLYYYGYRFYHPRLGRWINRDPIWEEGGGNLCQFVLNNPLNNIDIIGLLSYQYPGYPLDPCYPTERPQPPPTPPKNRPVKTFCSCDEISKEILEISRAADRWVIHYNRWAPNNQCYDQAVNLQSWLLTNLSAFPCLEISVFGYDKIYWRHHVLRVELSENPCQCEFSPFVIDPFRPFLGSENFSSHCKVFLISDLEQQYPYPCDCCKYPYTHKGDHPGNVINIWDWIKGLF